MAGTTPKIIAVSGKLGVGKDYLIDNVIKPFLKTKSYLHISFADQLKVNLMTTLGVSYEDAYIEKTPESRKLMQQVAEIERKRDKDVWINFLKSWLKVYSNRGIEYFLISDLRYENEYEFLKSQNACIIRIEAPQRNREKLQKESKGDPEIYKSISEHVSEKSLDNIPFENVIYNDPWTDSEEVFEEINYIINKHFA